MTSQTDTHTLILHYNVGLPMKGESKEEHLLRGRKMIIASLKDARIFLYNDQFYYWNFNKLYYYGSDWPEVK